MNYNPKSDYKNNAADELFKILESGANGLSAAEAKNRLATYGPNDISRQKKISGLAKFFSYFKNPLIILLLFASAISIITGEYQNAVIISLMVILSVVLNYYQENKSSQAAEQIAKKLAMRALVLRGGQQIEILSKDVVPGDIVLLTAGTIVPADGLLIDSDDFFVNESVLTGESFPVEKSIRIAGSQWLLSGTSAVSGIAKLLAVKTGRDTEYGKIAETLVSQEPPQAFEVGIKKFGILIIKVIMIIVAIIFLINAIKHQNLLDSLIFSIAVAVGVTPELLPMIMTVNMSRGAIKMAHKGVIVKRLNAIPDFGSMDVLCTDKTGTLTQDRITVVKHLNVYGENDDDVFRLAYINGSFESGIKSVLDKAIMDFQKLDVVKYQKIDEIPYDFVRRRSTIVCDIDGRRQMITKGAPEEIFKICKFYHKGGQALAITPEESDKFKKVYDDLSRQGFRVLAIAYRFIKLDSQKNYEKDAETDMVLSGFIAFYDPPKQSVKETVDFMEAHGVTIKILTGDSPLVAQKVCEDLKIKIVGIVSGENFDINRLSDEAIVKAAKENNIFARFSPMQKERIIEALKSSGFVVGYLGDGINDAPSLKKADVGISVDNAVDVAKETADIILMKKGLRELMEGVLEGRKTFGNTMKYLMMGLSSNFGNMFSMIYASIFIPFFPMLPGQILVNNFLYDLSQTTIPSDNVDAEYLKKPKQWDMKFIRLFMIIFGPISSVFDILTFVLLYNIFHFNQVIFHTGWFIESLATQTFVVYIIRTRKIPFLQSRPSKWVVFSTIGAVALGLVLTMPFIGKFLGFTFLPWYILLIILGYVIVYLFWVEGVKRIFYKHFYKGSRV
jgi:Mg2+-importing ATPase